MKKKKKPVIARPRVRRRFGHPRMGPIVAKRAFMLPTTGEPQYVVRMAMSEMDELCRELRAYDLERFAWEIEVAAPGKVDPVTGVWIKEARLSGPALELIKEKLSPPA